MPRTLMFLMILPLAVWTGCQAEREPDHDRQNINQNAAADQNDNSGAENENQSTPGANDNGTEDANDNGTPDSAGGTEPEQGVAALEHFESAQELQEYFKQQIRMHNNDFPGAFGDVGVDTEELPTVGDVGDFAGGEGEGEGEGEGGDGGAAPPPEDELAEEVASDADDSSFSTTTIQEEGVDEADVVKTDGQYFYVLTNDWYWGEGGTLYIVQAVPADDLQLLSSFSLDGWGSDLYLVGDLVVVLTSRTEYAAEGAAVDLTEFVFGVFMDAILGPDADGQDAESDHEDTGEETSLLDEFTEMLAMLFPQPETIVTMIDVGDRSDPTLVSQTSFEGNLASSRMIDGVLRLVIANYPDQYNSVLPLGMPQVDQLLELVELDTLLPDYQTTNADGKVNRGNVAPWDAFYRPTDPDGFGMTMVITLDTAARGTFEAVGIVAQPGLIYASTEALYITDTDYYFDFHRTDTDIYKFAFEPDNVVLVGAETVPGRILNQYSMGEHDGYLRVATTTDDLFDWETNEEIPSKNAVYVLGEDEGELTVVGSIEDLALGEEIQSARFLGSRGYLVTFEQTDPLFTLDLSSPTDPKVVGELEVPGFSTFITPMGQDHLLTVGVYVDPDGWGWSEGVQLSIFDVSDFADPQRTHNLVIGGWETYSEATWNPKAFTYFAAQDLVALPIENWTDDWGWEDEGMAGDAQDDICAESGWYGDGACDLFCPEPDPDCDDTGDWCEELGWYGDGVCDLDCPNPDPDCEGTGDWCEELGWYGDGLCDPDCPDPDPDCEGTGDWCEALGWYGDGVCDPDCPNPDPDCEGAGDWCEELGWYGDGVCDPDCPNPDPDCEGAGDWCEELGWYEDGVCDDFCPKPDPDCGFGNGNSSTTGLSGGKDSQEGSGGADDGGEGQGRDRPKQNLSSDQIGNFRGLFVFQVSAQTGFDYLGRISTDLEDDGFWYGEAQFTRGVFIEDHVYAVTDQVVVSAALDDVDAIVSTVELPTDSGSDGPILWPEPEEPAPSDTEAAAGEEGGEGRE